MARGKDTDLTTLQMALVGYELEKKKIDDKIREIRALLGRRGAKAAAVAGAEPAPRKRNLSPEARKRIAAAQKRRWAEHRKRAAQAKAGAKAESKQQG